MDLLTELDATIAALDDKIPANPSSQKNERLEKRMERALAQYFRSLNDAIDITALEQIYYRNVSFEETMTPADWKRAYAKGTPHWAKDKAPSIFAEEFVKAMRSHKMNSVLEIGCGNGRDSILFAKSKIKPTAIDIVPEALELAKANATKAAVKVAFKKANGEALPYKDGEFDAVFTLSVLHSTNLDKSLPELWRVLREGGIAFIYIYGDTKFEDGSKPEITIAWTDYIAKLMDIGFKITEKYVEREDEFDDIGEKHSKYIVWLEKVRS